MTRLLPFQRCPLQGRANHPFAVASRIKTGVRAWPFLTRATTIVCESDPACLVVDSTIGCADRLCRCAQTIERVFLHHLLKSANASLWIATKAQPKDLIKMATKDPPMASPMIFWSRLHQGSACRCAGYVIGRARKRTSSDYEFCAKQCAQHHCHSCMCRERQTESLESRVVHTLWIF